MSGCLCKFSLSQRFRFAQTCSIGFLSGEYGGRNKRIIPFASAILYKAFLLWNVALSMIITLPVCNAGHSILANQPLNKCLFIVPSYGIGESISLLHNPATRLTRAYFCPFIFTFTGSPFKDHPFSFCKNVSIPTSSR